MTRQAALRSMAYSALFVLFTMLFLLVNYPSDRLTEQLNSWIQSSSGGSLTVSEVHFRVPLSLEAESVALNAGQIWLDLGRVVINPHLLRFLSGKRGADVHLENPWMDLNLTLTMSKENRKGLRKP